MNIFVFGLNRFHNLQFSRFCSKISNYSVNLTDKIVFPINHRQILISRNLFLYLGKLDQLYSGAFYVYLYEPEQTVDVDDAILEYYGTVSEFYCEVTYRMDSFLPRNNHTIIDLRKTPYERRDLLADFWTKINARGRFAAAVDILLTKI